MTNQKALETFGNWDKKSLLAGITVGQGLKGRARAPQNPASAAPAGFPQDLWDAANRRADAALAAMSAMESGEAPDAPDDWEFDKDAFCFGVAAGRSLEGWEIDGGTNLSTYSKIVLRIHLDFPDSVSVNHAYQDWRIRYGLTYGYVDWGDENSETVKTPSISSEHNYDSGDYVIVGVFNQAINFSFSDAHQREVLADKWAGEHTNRFSGNGYTASYAGLYDDAIAESTLRAVYTEGDVISLSLAGCNKLEFCTLSPSAGFISGINQWARSWSFNAFNENGKLEFMRWAREHCSLQAVYYMGSAAQFSGIDFDGVHGGNSGLNIKPVPVYDCDGNIIYPPSSAHIAVPDGARRIGGYFYGSDFFFSERVEDITIPDSVTSIGNSAFSSCSALTSVTFGNGVTSIEQYAFSSCRNLSNLSIPDSVTSIGESAFGFCKNAFTNLVIPNGVTEIPSYAFTNCDSLISVTIHDRLSRIGEGAFYRCNNLTDIYYAGTPEQWQRIWIAPYFNHNANLQSVSIHYNSAGPD